MRFELIGKIPSKKNDLRRNKYGKYYHKEDKVLTALVLQLKVQAKQYTNLPIKSDCRLILELWSDDRRDFNNEITTICDLLENAGIVKNDRQFKQIEAYKEIDNKRARCEIEIWEQ